MFTISYVFTYELQHSSEFLLNYDEPKKKEAKQCFLATLNILIPLKIKSMKTLLLTFSSVLINLSENRLRTTKQHALCDTDPASQYLKS